uniref:ATP-binding cassette sub-family C member 9-like n=1 Tax=Saccoglossus kowalevskii TaxID=10224 RepID=A0ABM0N1I3_SACKO
MPLLELPFAISETVNAIISTRRFQNLFDACEVSEYVHGRPSLSKGYNDVSDIMGTSDGNSEEKQLSVAYNGHSSEHERDDLVHLIHDTPSYYGTFESESTDISVTDLPDHLAIQINSGSFAWDKDDEVVLTNINLNIPTGSLTMIIGLVGSGKSSLLSAMLGEMSLVAGTVQFNRSKCSISYVSQRPWVRNATLRENILFGEPFDYKRYQQILDVCSLQPDIDILMAGDNTEIGEKGINLSGGQKQRISVARALYSRTDIVILDDPLASLDVHVGAHLMESGIVEFLMEEERTVIVVTHHLQYLCHADQVVVMDGCTVARQGDLKEIQKHSPELYSDWQKSITVITESEASQSEGEDVNTERKHLLDVVKQLSNQSVDGIQED